jgi:hypothetical protein
MHTGKRTIPAMTDKLLDQVKSHTTSSITLGRADDTIETGLFQFIRFQNIRTGKPTNTSLSSKSSTPQLRFHGQHEERNAQGKLQALPGKAERFFWYDDTFLIMDTPPSDEEGDMHSFHRNNDGEQLIVRCFGHSNDPISRLLEYIKKDLENSENLQIYKVNNEAQQYPSTRDKRSISTIDMEPQMMRRIVREVTDFFHLKTRELYQASGPPLSPRLPPIRSSRYRQDQSVSRHCIPCGRPIGHSRRSRYGRQGLRAGF